MHHDNRGEHRSWSDLPWITAADRAGFALLCRELIDGYYEHIERCSICSTGTICRPLCEATRIVEEWRDGRELYRRAIALDQLEQRNTAPSPTLHAVA